MSEESKIASPGDADVIQLKDSDLSPHYVEFPDDTFFLESLAQNEKYKTGIAYVPAQRMISGQRETHIYEISPGMEKAKHIAGPVKAPDGSIDVTVFGSALDSAGILYLAAFNRNSILGLDLNKIDDTGALCELEVTDLASPNDVCVDPNNDSILYVAGGTFRYCFCCVAFTNAAFGKISKVELNRTDSGGWIDSVSVLSEGYNTLAGIEVVGDELWVAQLFDIFKQHESGSDSVVTWRGNDGKGQVWMADNIDTFDGDTILCPAYSTVSESIVDGVLNRPIISSFFLFSSQLISAYSNGEGVGKALRDPEVDLSFSNSYIEEGVDPAPIRLLLMKPSDPSSARHFEVELCETRDRNAAREIKDLESGDVLGKRHFFNEQVTHAAQMKDADRGYIVCVNFEQPRILFLDDEPFRKAMA